MPFLRSPLSLRRRHTHWRIAILAWTAARDRSVQTLSVCRMSRNVDNSSAVSAMRAASEWHDPARERAPAAGGVGAQGVRGEADVFECMYNML